jgi:phage RecT family recombinase
VSNAIQTKQVSYPPIVQLKADLLRTLENRKQSLGNIINERHIQIACLEIERNPALLKCSPRSIFESIVKAGLYKWVIGGVLGQAYIVPFKDEATLIAGYKGLRDLVRRSGQADTTIEAVHEGDQFTFNGPYAAPTHIPSNDANRRFKPITGAYVLVYFFASKTTKCFYWTVGQCLAHRDHYSKSWKRKPDESNLWHEKNDAFPVMCMKTVLRSVIARGEVPMALDDANLIHDPDEADAGPAATGQVIDAAWSPPERVEHMPDTPTEPVVTHEESQEAPEPSMDAVALEAEYAEAINQAPDDAAANELLRQIRVAVTKHQLDQYAAGRLEVISNAAWKVRHPKQNKGK